MTVGRTKEIPQPPIPWVIQIMRKGTKVGSANRAFTWSRLNVLAFMVGACCGKSASMASLSGSVRNLTVSGSVTGGLVSILHGQGSTAFSQHLEVILVLLTIG